MTDSLVDEENFPKANIDIYQVRHARNKIICTFVIIKDHVKS